MQEQTNFGECEGFLPEFSQTCPKSFCATFTYKLSPTTIIKTSFSCDLPKKRSSCIFLQMSWAPFFQVKQRWRYFPGFSWNLSGFSAILPRFLRILPGFSTNQNFWVALAPTDDHSIPLYSFIFVMKIIKAFK